MNLNLLVIRSSIPEQLADFYGRLGMVFEYHRHENGPFHFSAQIGSTLLEIYPLAKGQEKADKYLRLGVSIPFVTSSLVISGVLDLRDNRI